MQNEDLPWDDVRVLLAVHRQRSFLAAGKVLGLATSTVARRIDALERALGRVVVLRGSGGTVVESGALALVALAEEMELGLSAIQRHGDGPLAGTVRISAGEGLMRGVARVLAGLRTANPALEFELMSESHVVDVARHEADVAIRMVRSSSAAVVERPMGHVRLGLFASRRYVEKRLPSAHLQRAAAPAHDYVGFDAELRNMASEQWLRAYGARHFVLTSNSNNAIEEAIGAGLGIGILGEPQRTALPHLVQLRVDAPLPTSPLITS
jgi:DNA-binding transcriptional LysR family regulator